MESRSYPYNCVDLSDIPDRNFTLDIVDKITPKQSEAIRRARIPNQYQRFWVLRASRARSAILIWATVGATMCIHTINTELCILDMVHCAECRQESIYFEEIFVPITKSIQCWLRKTNVRSASRAQTLSKFRKTCRQKEFMSVFS